jgi:predicted secreted protein
VGTNSFRLFTGADGRVVVDYVTWAGSGGTSIAIATGSIQLLANGETGISFSGETVLAAPAPDGTLLTRPSGYTARSPSSEAPNLTFWSAYGRAMEPTNVGVALPMTAYNSSYLAVFGPDSGLWLGGGFSFYNGVASPRVVRLNRVVSEVAAGPTLLGTWPESPTVTAGQAITLHAAANSDGPVTYEWNLNGDEEWVYSSDLRRTIEPSITFRPGRPGEQKWAVRARNSAGASVAGHGRFHAAAATLAIATQPTRISAAVGRNAELWVEASPGVPGVRAEWRRNGAVLATTQAAIRYGGEDGLSPMAAYVLNPVTITDAGTYTVTLSGSDGQTVTSAPIVVSVGDSPRISNFSVRARVGTGEAGAVVGLVIPPGRSRQVVIRGIGPALGGFGIAGALANSRLELYRSTQRLFVNDRWDATSAVSNRLFDSLGAFRLTAGSPDAAIFSSGLPDSRLVPGSYTVRLSDRDGVNGVGLMEIYEADLLSERLPNLSARVEAGGGADAAIVGWTIVGPGSKRLLVRAVGPTLSAFGVVGYSTNPRLELRDAAGALLAANDDWQSQGDSAGVAAAARSAGAFALAPGSRDAACVASLPAGGYSLVVTGSDARAGLALIEVFELP